MYLFCICCKSIVATIKVPTLVIIDEKHEGKILHGNPRCTSENIITDPTEIWNEDIGQTEVVRKRFERRFLWNTVMYVHSGSTTAGIS